MPPALEHVRFFRHMTQDDRDAIAALMRPGTFAAGDVVYDGTGGRAGFHVVEAGRIEVALRLPGDVHQGVWAAGPGEVIGEQWLRAPATFPVRATAAEPTRTWTFDVATIERVRAQAGDVAFALLVAAARTASARARYVQRGIFGPGEGAPASVALATRPVAPEDLALARTIPLFRGLADDIVASATTHLQRADLARGAPLFHEGGDDATLAIVVRGAVETSVVRGGVKRRWGIAGPGRLVGEAGCFGEHPRSTDAHARESAILFVLPRAGAQALVKAHHPLALRLLDATVAEGAANLGVGRRAVRQFVLNEAQASRSSATIEGRPSVRST